MLSSTDTSKLILLVLFRRLTAIDFKRKYTTYRCLILQKETLP